MHRYLNTTNRSVSWFKKTFDADELEIKPPFQRNPVWSDRQKSDLIDTILMEYPIPELYMQDVVDSEGVEQHIVVDGQQRIRAVLSFLAGDFDLSDDSPVAPGLRFDDLSQTDRKKIYEYIFVVRLLPEMPDEELRIIFQRINRNTVTLNAQELRHATYRGPFITLMEGLSDLDFWGNFSIFSANDRRRMLDAEFISELTVAMLNGPQNKKRNLEDYYQQYETEFDQSEHVRTVFIKVLGELDQVLPNLSKTRWRKKSDFYTLFLCFARREEELPLAADKRLVARAALEKLAGDVDSLISGEIDGTSASERVRKYLRNVERAASDLASRRGREEVVDSFIHAAFV